MSKFEVSKFAKGVVAKIGKRSPEILTGIGIAGMIATTVLAVQATPKALQLLEEKREEESCETLTAAEVLKTTWKCYIPAAVTGVMSVVCIVGASSVHVRRNAALATAYTLSETAMREYKDKVIETIGEKKEQAVRDAIAKDTIDRNPVSKNEVIITEKGNTLCFDPITSRYFKSDIEKLRRAENELNRQLLNDGFVSLNDFYYEIGLSNIAIGDDLGWDTRDNLITLNFSSQLAEDGTPCVVLNFAVSPKYDYYH